MVSVLADVYYTYCHFRVFIPHCTLHTAITHVITALEWNSSCEFQWHTPCKTVPFKYWNYISDGTVCNVWVGLEIETTVFLYIRAHMVWVHPPITYIRVCVCLCVSPQVQYTLMQNALDAVGPSPPPALDPTSPTAVNDVPPPLPPGYHGSEMVDSGGTLTKVRREERFAVIECDLQY